MSNFFDDVLTDLDNVQETILGPEYEYWKMVRAPEAIGMSGAGSLSALASNIAGLIGYVEVLVAGGGRASVVNGPLGNRFFLKTGAKCRDKVTGNQVTRSLFVNNIPGGQLPFISSGMGVNFSVFRGLVPGTLESLANVNPLAIFQAFMSGTNPECSAVTLPTVSANNVASTETGYLTDPDIRNITPCLFTDAVILYLVNVELDVLVLVEAL